MANFFVLYTYDHRTVFILSYFLDDVIPSSNI